MAYIPVGHPSGAAANAAFKFVPDKFVELRSAHQTPDQPVQSRLLYPAELQAR